MASGMARRVDAEEFGYVAGTGSPDAPENDFNFEAAPSIDRPPAPAPRAVRRPPVRMPETRAIQASRKRQKRRAPSRGVGAFGMLFLVCIVAGIGFFVGAGVQSVVQAIQAPKIHDMPDAAGGRRAPPTSNFTF